MLPQAAAGAEVSMAFGDNLPPYILVQSDGGIEVDIVREALALRGHVLRARYMPMGRIPQTFISGQVDAIMMDVGEDMSNRGGHYASPPVLYDNIFYTLRQRGLRITQPADLKPLSTIAFVGAARRYPDWLGGLGGAAYQERNNQAAQPQLLAIGRYDVVLSDRTIFQYYAHLQSKLDPRFKLPALDEHAFTRADPRDYRPVFRDAAVRDDFNAGLQQLHKSGRYKAIYEKYLRH
ncbi:transporter substrate-binding domain-containing protein [Oxalobacteraceae bacterium]|nr:transporter substrate-binding domain-containing protein [Oxalobacteraceae bacterium]